MTEMRHEHTDIRPKTHDFDCHKNQIRNSEEVQTYKNNCCESRGRQTYTEQIQYKLKSACGDADEYWRNINLAPDREKYERTAHQRLVVELENKIVDEPSKYHFIIIKEGRGWQLNGESGNW